MDEYISASKTEMKEMLGKEPEFIVREHFLGQTDFCIFHKTIQYAFRK